MLGQCIHRRGRLSENPVLDRLTIAVQLLEGVGAASCLGHVLGEDELERDVGAAEPARGIDAGCQSEAHGTRIDGRRVDARAAHERLESGTGGCRKSSQAGERECPVLVDERDDVGDRGQGDQIEVPANRLMVGSEQRLAELVDHTGAAQLGERIAGRARRDDRAVGKHVGGPVMVGDDDLETTPLGLCDLVHGRDTAVDRHDEPHAVLLEPFERLAGDAIALREPARQVPDDVRAELAQEEDGERGRADAVDVVVAVDADARAVRNGGSDPLHRSRHVTEEQRVVARAARREEAPGVVRLVEPPANENRRGDLAHSEPVRKRSCAARIERRDRPGARHSR